MVFLDASPIIYFVEQVPAWGMRATARLAALRAGGEILAVTELIRVECLVGAVKSSDPSILMDFATFFSASDVCLLPITALVAERAVRIRANHRLQPMDSLHLATDVEHGCRLFLTNDARLSRFPDIPVEVLS